MAHKKGHIKKITGQGGRPLGSTTTTTRGGAPKPTTTTTTKKEINWEKWGDAAAKGEKLAEEAKNQRTLSGMSPRASAINKSGAGVYNYQPKQMSDSPGDTSPMVRFDSDYEKRKKSMGL